jgi:hypothetical protein
MSRKPLPLSVDPDLVLGTNGRLYANAASIPLADRVGRRVVRCVELTPGEEIELLRRIGDLTGDLLVGVTAKRGVSR